MKKTPQAIIDEIQRLHKEGVNLLAIAQRLGISRRVVRNYTVEPTHLCECGAVILERVKRCHKCSTKAIAIKNQIRINKSPSPCLSSAWQRTMTYKEYINSGIWKCEKSPTGAHLFNCDRLDNGACIYCGKPHVSREVEVPETTAELEYVAVY